MCSNLQIYHNVQIVPLLTLERMKQTLIEANPDSYTMLTDAQQVKLSKKWNIKAVSSTEPTKSGLSDGPHSLSVLTLPLYSLFLVLSLELHALQQEFVNRILQ